MSSDMAIPPLSLSRLCSTAVAALSASRVNLADNCSQLPAFLVQLRSGRNVKGSGVPILTRNKDTRPLYFSHPSHNCLAAGQLRQKTGVADDFSGEFSQGPGISMRMPRFAARQCWWRRRVSTRRRMVSCPIRIDTTNSSACFKRLRRGSSPLSMRCC